MVVLTVTKLNIKLSINNSCVVFHSVCSEQLLRHCHLVRGLFNLFRCSVLVRQELPKRVCRPCRNSWILTGRSTSDTRILTFSIFKKSHCCKTYAMWWYAALMCCLFLVLSCLRWLLPDWKATKLCKVHQRVCCNPCSNTACCLILKKQWIMDVQIMATTNLDKARLTVSIVTSWTRTP